MAVERTPQPTRIGATMAMSVLGRLSWHLLGARPSAGSGQGASWKRIGAKLERKAKRLAAESPQDLLARHHARCQNATEFVVGAVPVPTVLTDPSRWANVSEPIQAMLHLDLVDKVDRASMAVGLEVRCPFLDYLVIEFACSLPLSMRISRGSGKWILRKVRAR